MRPENVTEDCRPLFPNMPREVFDIWLGPLLTYYGLDVPGTEQRFKNDEWRKRLADHTFHEWSQFDWEKRSEAWNQSLLHPQSIERANAIAKHATLGVKTATADVKDTRKRFWICAYHVRNRPSSYTPLVAIMREGKLYLIDGHHRLAAILAQPHIKGFTLEVWLGSARAPAPVAVLA